MHSSDCQYSPTPSSNWLSAANDRGLLYGLSHTHTHTRTHTHALVSCTIVQRIQRKSISQEVLARPHRPIPKDTLEELHVRMLVRRDLDEARARGGREAGVCERALVEPREGAGVEGVLEVLQCEGVVQDRDIWK